MDKIAVENVKERLDCQDSSIRTQPTTRPKASTVNFTEQRDVEEIKHYDVSLEITLLEEDTPVGCSSCIQYCLKQHY